MLFGSQLTLTNLEMSFFDKRGGFPRESKGSVHIHDKLKVLGL